MSNKKGESLVEVIVALGILAFIFMGVINIVASSITLNLSARQRTEAVAMAQKQLNEYLAVNTNTGSCVITGREPAEVVNGTLTGNNIEGISCNETDSLTDSTQTCYWLEVAYLNTDTDIGPDETTNLQVEASNHNFIKVISHAKWFTRMFGEQEFEISRMIRND